MDDVMSLIAEVRDVLLDNVSSPMTIGAICGQLGFDVETADVTAALREMRKDGDVIRHDGPPASYELMPGQGGDTAPVAPPPDRTGLEDYDQTMTESALVAPTTQVAKPASARDLVKDYLEQAPLAAASLEEIVQGIGVKKKTVAKAMTDLVREGTVTRVQRGQYALPGFGDTAQSTGQSSQPIPLAPPLTPLLGRDALHRDLAVSLQSAIQARDTYLASIDDPIARHLQDGVRAARQALTEYEVRHHG